MHRLHHRSTEIRKSMKPGNFLSLYYNSSRKTFIVPTPLATYTEILRHPIILTQFKTSFLGQERLKFLFLKPVSSIHPFHQNAASIHLTCLWLCQINHWLWIRTSRGECNGWQTLRLPKKHQLKASIKCCWDVVQKRIYLPTAPEPCWAPELSFQKTSLSFVFGLMFSGQFLLPSPQVRIL